jgi:predicted RNase H-like HicB family nuclease
MAIKKTPVVRIQGKVECKIIKAKGGNWVAICDPLKLTLQAETWANLMEDIALTLDAMFKDLLSSNELNKFMREHRWKLIESIPAHQTDIRFDLPFVPVMMGSRDSQRMLHQ